MDDGGGDHDVQVFGLARLCGRSQGRIRELAGFQRGRHRVPEGHAAVAADFVDAIAAEQVAARAEQLFRALRTTFGYKRRQLTLSQVCASDSIAGPQFALRLWVEQDPEDPAGFVSTLELGGFSDPRVLVHPDFQGLFNQDCSTLVIALPRPVDVLSQVDALEDHPRLARYLDYDPHGAWLRLTIPEDDLRLDLTPRDMTLSLIGGPDLGKLIDRSRAAITAIRRSGAGDLLGEPGQPSSGP
jgi:hypothetical protein